VQLYQPTMPLIELSVKICPGGLPRCDPEVPATVVRRPVGVRVKL